jgi:hypothetical protein
MACIITLMLPLLSLVKLLVLDAKLEFWVTIVGQSTVELCCL